MRAGSFQQYLVAFFVCLSAVAARAEGEVEQSLTACLHNGTAIGGVNSCGKVWRLKAGHAALKSDGKLTVKVTGLVLNDASTGEFNGTPDGVDAVAAAVVCNGPSGQSVVAQTEPASLSKTGDAEISAKVALPTGCLAPVILLRERYEGKIGGWLAGGGF